MKKYIIYFLLLCAIFCDAQTVPAINGKPLVDVTTIASWDFALRPAGWYRIAKITGGYRGNATFELRENASHSTLRFEAGINYNHIGGSSFTLTSHSYFKAPTFLNIRILAKATFDDVYLEVYVDPHNNIYQSFYAYLINPLADGDWTLINWTNGAVPSGYTASEFNVDQLLKVGNFGNSNILSVNRNGNVGIGTTTPTEKLSVKGKIRAQEIKVEMSNWPDYVFAKNYKLPSLQQTEKHIKEKGHLPGMPSAADVKANGVNLGDINAKLLQKIEELTLHLIQQNKRLEQQEQAIQKLQIENKKL